MRTLIAVGLVALLPFGAAAQSQDETLADIRQELTVLKDRKSVV